MNRNIACFFLIAVAAAAGCKRDASPPAAAAGAVAEPVNAGPVNLPAEIARAKSENKLLLLEFGSSDACPPCILFQQEVFSQPEFLAYEKSNLVFVRLDFPQRTSLPPDIQATNVLLAQQFEAFAFPTFVALDHDGKEFWRSPEKNNPNPGIDTALFAPKNFIALLEAVRAKQK